jgi:hypothetical protein
MAAPEFDPKKAADPNFEAPDLVGHVEGWRAWKVLRQPPPYGLPPKLYSATYDTYYWTPRRAVIAECDRHCPEAQIPGENCSCGFYAARTYEHLMTMSYPQYDPEADEIVVIGQVAMWGKVIPGTLGWRAAKAYPVRLFVPFEALRTLGPPLQRGYGVPVRPMNWLGQSFPPV